MNTVTIFTDGGSRGNPGRAALGVSILTDSKEIAGFGKTLGINTNNFAEYSAVLAAYQWLLDHLDIFDTNDRLAFFMDSQLVCLQLSGIYKMKNPILKTIFDQIKTLEFGLRKRGITITYSHIPREQNKRADYFVNKALDENLK